MADHDVRTGKGRVAAWAVHLFTATGVVFALLALDAVERGHPREALAWLLVALVVDGVDGTLARAFQVESRVPRIDGAALDLVIDYLNYVLVPAFIIWRSDFLPDGIDVPLLAAILVSSLYVFARRDMKTDDGYFRGFPALWNVVALYFVVAPPAPAFASIIVAALVVLTFAPVHVVHPFRAADARRSGPVLATIWALATGALLVPGLSSAFLAAALGLSLVTLLLLIAIGLRRTFKGSAMAQSP
jgi:phosphatidylcholine synthase